MDVVEGPAATDTVAAYEGDVDHQLRPEQLVLDTTFFLRSYTKFFIPRDLVDVALLCHANGICVISLVPRPPDFSAAGGQPDGEGEPAPPPKPLDGTVPPSLVAEAADATMGAGSAPQQVSVRFLASPKGNMSAKSMRKPPRRNDESVLQRGAPLLEVVAGAQIATIACPVRSKLLETNDRLAADPAKMLPRWYREGWAAIVQVQDRDMPTPSDLYLTAAAYAELRGVQLPFSS